MIYKEKDFLGMKDLSAEDIHYILNTAESMKFSINQKNKKNNHLQGKSITTLFYQESSKSRLSFEVAAQNLGASITHLNVSKSNEKGESLKDIANVVSQTGTDIIVMRHPLAGAPHYVANYLKIPIINAGDGLNENPVQSLLDLMTIKEKKGNFEGLNVSIIGDVINNRVTRSNIWALKKLGANICIAGPPTLIPDNIKQFGIKVYNSVSEALIDADIVLALRLHNSSISNNLVPSINEYKRLFKIDSQRLKYAKKDVVVMHSGLVNRGVEIDSDVLDYDTCLINNQIYNGVSVRMALLYIMSKKGVGKFEVYN